MLTGFTAGLLLITLSELGDKTFFIGLILATRHPRRWVFLGVILALGGMTVLSVALGQIFTLLPRPYVEGAAIALFLGFGFKLLYDASQMSSKSGLCDEQAEAEQAIACSTLSQAHTTGRLVVMEALALTFVAEWGDRTQLATITLSAAHPPLGVMAGAILGHAICTAIAVMVGRLVAGKLSERLLTALGGGLFVIFGWVALVNFEF
ncbi:TMEM165/GDT1 family protein [Leptolyngbya sp. PCC 6406]|uniref:TMEM165/GDT1 family protein n=1 Tax=Leptolyngbya sp. PCC 6406 TaxID=1173264 RepID=UPI0002AC3669|nr:TMEM165/GDT1 family protein [Leptolyngbya sp. PCC 6406]